MSHVCSSSSNFKSQNFPTQIFQKSKFRKNQLRLKKIDRISVFEFKMISWKVLDSQRAKFSKITKIFHPSSNYGTFCRIWGRIEVEFWISPCKTHEIHQFHVHGVARAKQNIFEHSNIDFSILLIKEMILDTHNVISWRVEVKLRTLEASFVVPGKGTWPCAFWRVGPGYRSQSVWNCTVRYGMYL